MNNLTKFSTYSTGVNDASGGLLGLMIVIILWLIIFIGGNVATQTQVFDSFSEKFTIASFLTLIGAGLLYYAEWIAIDYLYVLVVMIVIGVFIMIYERN